MEWKGVMPAITTCFDENLQIDHEFTAKHVKWLVENGCTGIVCNGSLGEGATLSMAEKFRFGKLVLKRWVKEFRLLLQSPLSTEDAVAQAKLAADSGCRALMVLPPYVYRGDWRENKYHLGEVFRATDLSCMLYNNPIAYGTDYLPEQIQELAAEFSNFHAIKESSADVRRVMAIRALIGDKLKILVGVDDAIVEGINAGATGWIAGLVSAFPKESVDLFNYTMNGETEKAFELYRWFLPLLRLDTVPKFVQLIKLVQEKIGMGSVRVRPPRMELVGQELEETLAIIETALATKP